MNDCRLKITTISKSSLPTICFRNIHTEDANAEQSKLLQELTDINKGEKPIEKKSSKKTFDFSLMQVKNILYFIHQNKQNH